MTAEPDVMDEERTLDDDVIDAMLRRAEMAPATESLPGGIRQPKRRAFLAAYARTGNISEAARIAGINRNSHYEWLANDEHYAEVFGQAHEIAIDYLEAVARQRATEGWLKPVYQGGKLVGHVREFSDTLLIFLLKGAKPDKYRDNATIRHTGPTGGALQIEADYDLSRRLMGDPDALELAQALAAAVLQETPPAALDAGPAPIPTDSEEVTE